MSGHVSGVAILLVTTDSDGSCVADLRDFSPSVDLVADVFRQIVSGLFLHFTQIVSMFFCYFTSLHHGLLIIFSNSPVFHK